LPLFLEEKVITTAGGIIIGGLVICCLGLYFAAMSLQTRDMDEAKDENSFERDIIPPTEILHNVAGDNKNIDEKMNGITSKYSTIAKFLICLTAGIMASMLQFAFVFGQPMIDLASANGKGPGSTPKSGEAAIIWLFAFPLSAPVSIIWGIIASPQSISILWKCRPWYRHVLIFLSTTIPWSAHIHLYGLSNTTFLPPDLAASVSWPVLMMITVLAGMMWSIVLGEWSQASLRATRQRSLGLIVVVIGVSVLMVSMVVAH